MKITMESTSQLVNGLRLWRGVTASGVPCVVLVAAIGSESDQDLAAIQAELRTLATLGAHAVVALVSADEPGAAKC